MLSLILIILLCSSPCLAIETNYLFNSNRFPDATSVPTLSNGNLGFTVFGDSVYLTGVYNGLESQSHRARIPNYANIQLETCSHPETNPPYCSYQLDIKFGYFRTIYDDPNGVLRLIHTVYPHRYYNHVIVNNIRFQRLNGQGPLYANIRQAVVEPSSDITFDPAENAVTPDKTYMCQCGQTNEVEDPELQTERTKVCVYYKDVPSTLVLPENSTAEEFGFYTVFARSRTEAEADLRGLLLSIKPNEEQSSVDSYHEKLMSELWDQYGITVDGNDELDRAIKASAFLLYSNVPTLYTHNAVQTYGISPSGIGRNDFQGHVMWDFDMWMFPVVLLADPVVAENMLTYRTRVVQKAVESNAALNGNEGWQFPWASAFTGREVSPNSEAADIQHHITADVAFAVRQFMYATGNMYWMRTQGCELAYNTARFWKSRAVYNSDTDKYDIHGVTGPDTMNPNVTNSVFTNVVAANNLFLGEYAACVCNTHMDIHGNESDEMIQIAKSLHLLHNSNDDFNPQFEGYVVGQRISQADAVLLGYPLDLPMEKSTKRQNLEIYGLVTENSTMTWAMHTIGWLELDELEKAADSLRRSYQPYLRLPFNVWNQGSVELPGASNYVSGASSFLHTMINGYAGIRLRHDELVLDRPRLPPGTTRLSIPKINFHHFELSLEIHQNGTFSITQKALISRSWFGLLLNIDGETVHMCNVYNGCVYQGSHSASIKVERDVADCNMKPTELNMRLADQNHAATNWISPMSILTVAIASVLNFFL